MYFQDTMIQGPFRSMQHDHIFRALSPDLTEMETSFALPPHCRSLGAWPRSLVLRRYMRSLLCERNAVLKETAESLAWQRFLHS